MFNDGFQKLLLDAMANRDIESEAISMTKLVKTIRKDMLDWAEYELPSFELWVAFGMGKSYQEIRINSVYDKLGKDKSIALPYFHAFTGCDTTSQFFGKGKSSAWVAWESFPEATEAFCLITLHPFVSLDTTSAAFQLLRDTPVFCMTKLQISVWSMS